MACLTTAAAAEARTLYVSASAKSPGKGTRDKPFRSLERVERASRRGDRIVVLPGPRKTAPLDGGIRLKPGQTLVGGGPSVLSRKARRRAPRIANTAGKRHAGDAVRVAERTVVRNLVIAGAHRGGIYGRNVRGVTIRGNDVSGHNTSCTPGFHIPPFVVPTVAPGAGVPISGGLSNG